jgi:surface antigen
MSVSISAAGLAPGTYNGTITFTAAGATGSPKTVGVTLTVTQGPALGTSPATLTFSANQGTSPANQTFTVTNTGGGTLAWSASASASWLSATPASGSLGAGTSASPAVSVSTAGLAPGTYNGSIQVTAAGATGSPRTVAVTLNVTSTLFAAPVLGSPANGATGVSVNPTFTWSPVSGANRYWLMVATSPSVFPTDPAATSCAACVISGNVGGTSYTVPQTFTYNGHTTSLNAGTVYYWKVQGWNTDGRQGQYSAAWTFTTANPAVTAVLSTLTPNPVEALNARQAMTLLGSGFSPGTHVFYRNRYQVYELPQSDIQMVSPAELRVYVNLGATAASWYVSVQNTGTARSPEIVFRTVGNDYPSSWIIGPPCDSGADAYNFVKSNCTSFVAWRLDGDGKRIDNVHGYSYTCSDGRILTRWSNANCWDESARRLGLRVDKSAEVGAVAQWNAGAAGHVAYVAAVYLDTGEILVEEYNYSFLCRYDRRRIRISSVENFIHF